ncbi:universal stress protein [Rubrobacter tropicus]|uniref:universal stress protein n=1 Tax=Rubrobacter tropicus TaxID=2653851 RepID=UPI001408171A|nr:universal stress protein [Rubrobacter tropicus]
MFPTKILLAVDGSTGSDHAARTATNLSRALDSELRVVLVGARAVDPGTLAAIPLLGGEPGTRAREALERDARARLEGAVEKIRASGGEVSEARVEFGSPDVEIVRLAEELDAGLVVVGSRGLGPLRRAVMGGVSRSVVRHAHCPVLVARGGHSGPSLGPILVCLDGSRRSAVAAGAGAEISAATGAALHVVYVMRPERYRPQFGPEAWEGWQENLKRASRDAASWVEERAARLREEAGVKSAEAHLAFGEPAREVVRLAEEVGAGMVVVGSRGLGGVRRMLLGSVSDAVVEHAPCPVMVVRAGVPGRKTEG